MKHSYRLLGPLVVAFALCLIAGVTRWVTLLAGAMLAIVAAHCIMLLLRHGKDM